MLYGEAADYVYTAIDKALEPTSVDLEKMAEKIILELKRQNLAEDKNIGRTEYKVLICLDGICDVNLLAKAVLDSLIEQGVKVTYE
jgi:hypothetical protein